MNASELFFDYLEHDIVFSCLKIYERSTFEHGHEGALYVSESCCYHVLLLTSVVWCELVLGGFQNLFAFQMLSAYICLWMSIYLFIFCMNCA